MTDGVPVHRTLDRSWGEQLLAINRACSITADATVRFDREPEFFAWPDRVFDDHRYLGIFVEGQLVGFCLSGFRTGWLGTKWARFAYGGDVRLLPAFRGRGLAREAALHAVDEALREVDIGIVVVKQGNVAGGRLAATISRPGSAIVPLGPYDVFSVPLLHRLSMATAGAPTIRIAEWRDLEQVAALLTRWGTGRLLAPLLDEAALRAQWERPGIGPEQHLVAERTGRIIGVLGLWDLHDMRQVTLLRYCWSHAPFRAAFRIGAALRPGIIPLPPPGGALRSRTVTDLAVDDDDPSVLARLLATAVNQSLGQGYHMVQIGFFRSDPLRLAVRGMLAQRFTSDVFAVSRPNGGARLCVPGRVPYLDLPMV